MVADNLAGIEGLQVGLIGFGTIGRAVAQAFARMGAKVCFFDPATSDAQGVDARPVSLDELLATSDVVSLHVPLLPATQNLIGARELARMKPGAVLIQASRGGIADEAALAASLNPLISAARRSMSIRPNRPRQTIRCSSSAARRRCGSRRRCKHPLARRGRRPRSCSAPRGRTSSAC